MSIKDRISGAARSISVASRQRGFSAPSLDQNGFTASSICSTIRPQRVLRNLNLPVSGMALSSEGEPGSLLWELSHEHRTAPPPSAGLVVQQTRRPAGLLAGVGVAR